MTIPWIKMRHDLDTDPAVILLCHEAEVSTETAIGILWRLWTWADKHSTDGFLPGVTGEWLAQFLRNDCAPVALERAGWLRIDSDGLRIPNFNVHNCESAKKRAEKAKRIEKTRDDGGRFTVTKKGHRNTSHGDHKSALDKRRGDKRREDKKLSICASSDLFSQFWELYPRKVGKRRAEVAWRAAIKDTPAAEIIAAVTIFAKSPKARSEFVPHPTTFLNQGRWLDDPKDWQDGQPTPEERKPRLDPDLERNLKLGRIRKCSNHELDQDGYCKNCGASQGLIDQIQQEIDGREQATDDKGAAPALEGGARSVEGDDAE